MHQATQVLHGIQRNISLKTQAFLSQDVYRYSDRQTQEYDCCTVKQEQFKGKHRQLEWVDTNYCMIVLLTEKMESDMIKQ